MLNKTILNSWTKQILILNVNKEFEFDSDRYSKFLNEKNFISIKSPFLIFLLLSTLHKEHREHKTTSGEARTKEI